MKAERMESLASSLPEAEREALLRAWGVAPGFIDFSGQTVITPDVNRLHQLEAMTGPLDSRALHALVQALEQPRTPAWLLSVPGQSRLSFTCPLCSPQAGAQLAPLRWRLVAEQGGLLAEGDWQATKSGQERVDIEVPPLPEGYHTLSLQREDWLAQVAVIVAPPQCYQPDWLASGGKCWGVAIQLYTLRSEDNWGMGDLADLQSAIPGLAAQGADFLLLNPLHASDQRYPDNASPYSPSDRRFLNPLYLRPEAEQDFFTDQDNLSWFASQGGKLKALRQMSHVNYAAVAALKYEAFARMFRQFERVELTADSGRAREFQAYVQGLGESGARFARFVAEQALPEADCPQSRLPTFHLYLQWRTSEALKACQAATRSEGMRLGLVRDLAVGSTVDSAEVLTEPSQFCLASRIGAPPDHFSPEGQNWGLPPLSPQALDRSAGAFFRGLLRHNMTHCGALRIDHVMALMRLWWCPEDGSNANGAYVHYPADLLFAILRLESHRQQTMVIGEDLGVVPPEIRHYLDEGQVFSNLVFYFEKYDGWHFRHPHDYRQRALAIIANHDVPTLKAWWNAEDVRLRRRLELTQSDEAEANEATVRAGEKGQMLKVLAECGLLPAAWSVDAIDKAYDSALGAAMTGFCARTASQLVSIQLDDLAMLDTPINVPGTHIQYPNWRRKLPASVASILETEAAQQLLAPLREHRGKQYV